MPENEARTVNMLRCLGTSKVLSGELQIIWSVLVPSMHLN